MRTTCALLLALACCLRGGSAFAQTVIIPNTFTSGTTAKAADVNANFTAMQTVVNAHDTRLTADETTLSGKQNLVTGTCTVGTAVTAIAANGSVTCANTTYSAGPGLALSGTTFSASFAGTGAATTVARSDHTHANYVPYSAGDSSVTGGYTFSAAKTGYVSLSALSLIGESIVRHVGYGEAYLYPGITAGWATWAVNLPQGATVVGWQCTLRDNDAGYINAILSRNSGQTDQPLATVSTQTLAPTIATQTITTTAITNPIVDNSSWAYYVQVYLNGTPNTTNLEINNCLITYTVTELAP